MERSSSLGSMEQAFGPEPALPPAQKTVYLETGESVYDYGTEFGEQPSWTKEDLNGQPIVIRGLSEEVFEAGYQVAARSVLHTLPEEPEGTTPWGMFFSDDSPIVRQTRERIRKGRVPFIAVLRKRPSELHKGQSYWTLERYMPNVTPETPTTNLKKG
jgi:hypothetical protein